MASFLLYIEMSKIYWFEGGNQHLKVIEVM